MGRIMVKGHSIALKCMLIIHIRLTNITCKEGDMEDQPQITSDDQIWAALGYPIPIVALIVLLMEEKKNRPFLKFHAIQSIVLNIAIWILIVIFSTVTLGFGAICAPLIWLVTLWPAFDSYNRNYTKIPIITDFIKSQGWV